jgi:hypothetical protein
MPYDNEEAGLLSEGELNEMLASLPRRFHTPDIRRIRSERMLLRTARRMGLIGARRAWPRGVAAVAALVLFVAGYGAGSLGGPAPGLEAAIAERATTSELERQALVQRAGTAYLRALHATMGAGSAPDALQPQVRGVALAAARLTGGPADGGTEECLLPFPPSPQAQLVAF